MKITRAQAEAALALPKIKLEDAKKMLDETYELIYIHHDDSISDPDQQQEIVDTGWCDSLDDNFWMDDQRYESAKQIMDEVFKDFDIEDIEDDLRQAIFDRDRSTPLDDLIRNTNDPVMYYDLDVEVDGYGCDVVAEAKKIARALKLNYKNHEQKFKTLVANASYGGNLRLLFRGDFDLFHGETGKPKFVIIQDPEVCIMDRFNGSGYSENGFGDFKVRFDRTRFKVDEAAPGYSYAGDVCGMIVESTGLRPARGSRGVIGPKRERELTAAEKQEIADENRWKETGVCRFGDMKMSRHKTVKYINEFPCGNHCMECKTFWID